MKGLIAFSKAARPAAGHQHRMPANKHALGPLIGGGPFFVFGGQPLRLEIQLWLKYHSAKRAERLLCLGCSCTLILAHLSDACCCGGFDVSDWRKPSGASPEGATPAERPFARLERSFSFCVPETLLSVQWTCKLRARCRRNVRVLRLLCRNSWCLICPAIFSI